jgi:hypothetical protein
MDMSKFKVSLEGLNFLKSYSSLLWPIIIGLAAVVFLILSPLMGGKLEKRISKESISTGKEIKYLSEEAVSARQSDEEKKYQDAYENDANQIAALAEQSSRRELLSYNIFPEPKDTSSLIFDEFSERFLDGLDELLVEINAKDCPTDAELERAVNSSSALNSRTRRGRSRRGRMFGVRRGRSSQLNEVDDMIVAELCRARAESASVYGNSADLSGYGFWEVFEYTGMDKAVEECWYWQLGYWIIEDVIDTIGATNSGSESVLTSPVKRLIHVSFIKSARSFSSRSRGRRRRQAGGAGTRLDRPSYVLSIRDGFTEPCTDRLCSDDIDVVHFTLSVLVRTKDVPLFMQQFCSSKEHKFRGFSGNEPEGTFTHNQITILEYDISPINRSSEEHKLYEYGEDALVKLDLICEYIFDRKGYDEIKPEAIKKALTSSG